MLHAAVTCYMDQNKNKPGINWPMLNDAVMGVVLTITKVRGKVDFHTPGTCKEYFML